MGKIKKQLNIKRLKIKTNCKTLFTDELSACISSVGLCINIEAKSKSAGYGAFLWMVFNFCKPVTHRLALFCRLRCYVWGYLGGLFEGSWLSTLWGLRVGPPFLRETWILNKDYFYINH